MESEEGKKFFVLIKFGGDIPIRQRIMESARPVKEAIEKISRKDCQLVFTSDSGDCFGYFLKTSLPAGVVRAELEGRTQSSTTSALGNGDSVFVLEVGEEFDGLGFSRGWTWLQHR
jgi:hypothetical protein